MSNSKFKIIRSKLKRKIKYQVGVGSPLLSRLVATMGQRQNDFFRCVFTRKRLEHIQFIRGARSTATVRHRMKMANQGSTRDDQPFDSEQSYRDYDKSMPSILAAAVENYFNNSPKPYLETIPIVQFNIKKDAIIKLTLWNYPFPN